ncbi:MAG: hypothetical protein U0610_07435 [bacterium]
MTSERRAIGFLCWHSGWRAILAHPAGAWRHDFLVLRSIHVEEAEVSPVLVISVLCIPIYGWAWSEQPARILLVACRRAELPWKNDGFTRVAPASATTLGDATREDLRVRRLASCVAHRFSVARHLDRHRRHARVDGRRQPRDPPHLAPRA